MNRMPVVVLSLLSVAVGGVSCPRLASASSATWNGSVSAAWSDVSNWDGPPAGVPGTGDTATFSGAGNGNTVIDLGGGVTLLSLSILSDTAARYTIGAGVAGSQSLTFGAGGTVTVGASVTNDQLIAAGIALTGATTFYANTVTNLLTLAGPVTGSGALTKTGTGHLVLNGDNSFSGGSVLGNGTTSNVSTSNTATASSGGFVIVGHNNALGTGSVSAKGAQLRAGSPGLTLGNAISLDGAALRFGGFNDLTLSGPVTLTAAREIGNYSVSRTLTLTGPLNMNTYTLNFMAVGGAAANGTTEVKGPITGTAGITVNTVYDNGLVILSGDNSGYTGNTTVNAGTLRVAHSNALVNTGMITMNDTDAEVELANGIRLGRPLTIGNTGNNKTLRVQSGATAEFSGAVKNNETGAGNFDLAADAGSTLTVSGPIVSSAGAGVTKLGEGFLILPVANTALVDKVVLGNATSNISGTDTATALSGGFVVVCHSNALGMGTVSFKGAQIRAGIPSLVITNAVSVDQGALRFSGTNDLELSGTATLVTGSNRGFGNYSGTRLLAFSGNVVLTGGYSLVVQGLNDAAANGTVRFSGPVSGDGLFEIDSSFDNGLVILAGNNSYTGRTTVSAGTLRLDYGAQDNSKLANAASLTLASSALELVGGSHLEQVSATAVSGDAAITRSSGAAVLALGSLSVSGALCLSAEDIASTTSANINGLLDGVTVTAGGATRWAANSGVSDGSSGYLIRAFGGSLTDVARLGGVIPDDAALNVRIANGGVSGNVTLASSSNKLSTLTMDASDGPATLDMAGAVLNLGAQAGSGIIQTGASGGLTVGTVPNVGLLTAGGESTGSAATLTLANDSLANALTIHSPIGNNGSETLNLAKSGPGTVVLTATNTYSGTTRIAAGTLQIDNGGASSQLGTGAIRNDGKLLFARGAGSADLLVANTISGSGTLTQSGAANTRVTLQGTLNSYAGGTTVASGCILRAEDTNGDTEFLQLGTGPVTLNGGSLELRGNGGLDDVTIVTGDGVNGNSVALTASSTLDVARYTGTARVRNTFRLGGLTLGGCTFSFVAANKYRASFAGPVTLTGNATFAPLLNDTSSWLSLDGPVTDSGFGYGFTKLEVGTLVLNGNSTFSGDVSLGNGATNNLVGPNSATATAGSGGFVVLGHNNALGSGLVHLKGAQIRAGVPGLVIPNNLIITNGGFRFGGSMDLRFSGKIKGLGAIRGISNCSYDKTLTLQDIDASYQPIWFEGIDNAASNGTILVLGIISGSKEVAVKFNYDNGLVAFCGTNTYTGPTTIDAGAKLQLGNGGTTGSLSPLSAIANSGTLAFKRSNTITQGIDFDGLLSGTGGVRVEGSGETVFTGTNIYTGATVILPGATLQLGAGGALSPASLVTAHGTLAVNRSDTVSQGTHFAATVDGAGGIAQRGAGTLVLTGANTYLGTTDAEAGTLLINGSQPAATGPVNVAAGATLGGTGTSGGAGTIAAGGILSPGAGGVGTLALGSLALQPGAIFRWDVASVDNDAVAVTGNLTLPNSLTLNVHRLELASINQRVLFTYGGVYAGPEKVDVSTTGDSSVPCLAVHDAANKRIVLKVIQTGAMLSLR